MVTPPALQLYTIAPQNTIIPHGLNTFQRPVLYIVQQFIGTAQLQESVKVNDNVFLEPILTLNSTSLGIISAEASCAKLYQ